MQDADVITFTRLTDGTLLQRHAHGAFRPVISESDRTRLAALTEEEIERMRASDPDHAGLDDAFWSRALEKAPPSEVGFTHARQ